MYCIHCCCNTYSIYSFVFMGYSTIIINLKQNSIVLWNKGFSTPIPQLSIPLFPEVVTVTGFLRSFQRYPIHRQVWGRGARVSVCVGGGVYLHICAQERQKKQTNSPTMPHQSGVCHVTKANPGNCFSPFLYKGTLSCYCRAVN